MLTENTDIQDDEVRRALRSEWNIDPGELEFLPVGGDSWSYRAGDLIVSVRDALGQRKPWGAPRQIEESLAAAVALRERCGLEFLLTPCPTKSGRPIARVGRFALTLFPFIDGEMSWETPTGPELEIEIASWIERLHAATPGIADLSLASEEFVPDYAVALRDALDRACSGRVRGPYTSRLLGLMQSVRDEIVHAFDLHEAHGARLATSGREFVVTHGEPSGNVLLAHDGSRHLIDLVEFTRAPPERDLQDLPEGVRGADVDEAFLAYYRQHYALSEVAEYADRLSLDHEGDAEDERAWNLLNEFIAVALST